MWTEDRRVVNSMPRQNINFHRMEIFSLYFIFVASTLNNVRQLTGRPSWTSVNWHHFDQVATYLDQASIMDLSVVSIFEPFESFNFCSRLRQLRRSHVVTYVCCWSCSLDSLARNTSSTYKNILVVFTYLPEDNSRYEWKDDFWQSLY